MYLVAIMEMALGVVLIHFYIVNFVINPTSCVDVLSSYLAAQDSQLLLNCKI